MSFDYNQAALDAKEIIEFWGTSGSLVMEEKPAGYDDSGNVIPAIPSYSIKGTITPLLDYETSEINGSSIKDGDSYIYFDSTSRAEINMVVTINGEKWRINDIMKLESVGGTLVYQKLQLRK